MVTMERSLNPQFSKVHLTNLNLDNFKMIEVLELKSIATRSAWVALFPYQISWKSTKWLRSY
jgi:hypothetical protein